MTRLLSHPAAAAATGGGALLSSSHHFSFQIANPIPSLFSKRQSRFRISRGLKPLTLATSAGDSSGGAATKSNSDSSNTIPFDDDKSKAIAFVSQENVPLEGVIQFEKPNSSSLIVKWGLLSAYLLGGYGDDGKGKNGLNATVTVATKSWSIVGINHKSCTIGHIPPTKFILVTMGSTAVLLIGWRALSYSVLPSNKSKKNDAYKRGSPFELFELLTSLIRRW